MAKERILVVDDEEDILELLRYNLFKEGYDVICATTGEEALQIARAKIPDLVILDLMLTGLSGLDVARLLKQDPHTADTPVMMLTAKGEESDIVAGLELGADDYVTKPFSPRVLVARVRAILRRNSGSPQEDPSVLKIRGLVIHLGRHEAIKDGKRLDLTSTEFRLLHFLARRPGWVFTRAQIVDAVHGEDYPVTERAVDVQVAGLRKKLQDKGEYVETVRGVGYRFREN